MELFRFTSRLRCSRSGLWLLLVLAVGFSLGAGRVEADDTSLPIVYVPKTSLGPEDVGIVINLDDPLSRQIGEYYQQARQIPAAHVVRVRFAPGRTQMSSAEFARVKRAVDRQTPAAVQAFVLTWAAPYRVDCMSITTAFAVGFDEAWCARGCQTTKPSAYFNSNSLTPYADHGLRPTMSLAATSFEEAKRLIDRGVQADFTYPHGTGYLVDTSDTNRNVRAGVYDELIQALHGSVALEHVKADYLNAKPDVLFYFTGRVDVPGLASLHFLPGAIGDHLTSAGGQLTDSKQMSSLRWLEAGATGSYGAVVEPCNFPAKFPDPRIVVGRYVAGESLIEAYWKSVLMPGQGIFIGEPLANPYGGVQVTRVGDDLVIRTRALRPGLYAIQAVPGMIGPGHPIARYVRVAWGPQEIRIRNATDQFYRIVPEPVASLFTEMKAY